MLPVSDLPPPALDAVVSVLPLQDAAMAACAATALRDASKRATDAASRELAEVIQKAVTGGQREIVHSGTVPDGVWLIEGTGEYRRVFLVHLPPPADPEAAASVEERAMLAAICSGWKDVWLAGRVGMGPPHIFYHTSGGDQCRMGFVPHRTRLGVPPPNSDAASLAAAERLCNVARVLLKGQIMRHRPEAFEAYPNDDFVL